MSEAQLREFLYAIKSDGAMRKRLSAASTREEIVQIANDMGFDLMLEFISEDVLSVLLESVGLSDEDLESISGGEGYLEQNKRPTPTHSQRFDFRCCRR